MLEIFPKAPSVRETADFLAGGGEMGERMREMQWSRTPLGPPSEWPAPLRHAVRLLLGARQPMSLWWGDALVHLYNDSCRLLLGPNHPSALGMAARIVWGDHWDELEARADAALRRHEGSTTPPLRFLVERQGAACEAHYRMCGAAVPGEHGGFGGVLWTFLDATADVTREREVACLDALRRAASGLRDVRDACARTGEALAASAEDFPFAALYAVDAPREEAWLVARAGAAAASQALPEALMLGDACPWPLAAAADSGFQRIRLEDPAFGRIPEGPWDRPPREAIVAKVAASEGASSIVLVAGLNPYRPWDAPYERFVSLACSEIGRIFDAGLLAQARREREAVFGRIAELEQADTQLRELDRRKNEFLATLAHELRNPLAPLRNGLEVIRLANGDAATIDKARGMMQRQLQQMVRLVDDLLDVSRVSRGKIELRRADVDMASVLRTAIEASQPLMGERGHSLAARLPRERIVLDGDGARLSQVFWNLLNNAAKYTEPGGRIELDAAFQDGAVVVRVKDDGIGIPPEMQDRVFEIFTQVDRSLERSQGGLGIGLSIAKRLVEMHGGSIAVRSEGLRKGTEFTVRLPARVDGAQRAAETDPHLRPIALGKRILIADDNPDSAETLQLMLEVMGNEVRVARDGEEAVKMAQEFAPDAILMDIGMPKMNGYDASACIRSLPAGRGAFIVALTGWGMEEDKQRSKAAGFDRHLVKPVEPRMLEELLR